MEPRKQVLKKSTEQRKEAGKSRFQILKLEERIAPKKGGIPGWCSNPEYCVKPCHGAHGKCIGV